MPIHLKLPITAQELAVGDLILSGKNPQPPTVSKIDADTNGSRSHTIVHTENGGHRRYKCSTKLEVLRSVPTYAEEVDKLERELTAALKKVVSVADLLSETAHGKRHIIPTWSSKYVAGKRVAAFRRKASQGNRLHPETMTESLFEALLEQAEREIIGRFIKFEDTSSTKNLHGAVGGAAWVKVSEFTAMLQAEFDELDEDQFKSDDPALNMVLQVQYQALNRSLNGGLFGAAVDLKHEIDDLCLVHEFLNGQSVTWTPISLGVMENMAFIEDDFHQALADMASIKTAAAQAATSPNPEN